MKLRNIIRSAVASGLLVAMLGSQALAYQTTSDWSGYLGYNAYTKVATNKPEMDSDSYAHASWDSSENSSKGCRVAIYTSDDVYITSRSLVKGGDMQSIYLETVPGRKYTLKAKLRTNSMNGVYNAGTWEP